jgi:hypothetical protein
MSNVPEGFPTGPNTAELLQFLAKRPIPVEATLREMVALAERADPGDLPTILRIGQMSGFMDEVLAEPALVLLPCWGMRGLDVLHSIVRQDRFYSYYALTLLVSIAHV